MSLYNTYIRECAWYMFVEHMTGISYYSIDYRTYVNVARVLVYHPHVNLAFIIHQTNYGQIGFTSILRGHSTKVFYCMRIFNMSGCIGTVSNQLGILVALII